MLAAKTFSLIVLREKLFSLFLLLFRLHLVRVQLVVVAVVVATVTVVVDALVVRMVVRGRRLQLTVMIFEISAKVVEEQNQIFGARSNIQNVRLNKEVVLASRLLSKIIGGGGGVKFNSSRLRPREYKAASYQLLSSKSCPLYKQCAVDISRVDINRIKFLGNAEAKN